MALSPSERRRRNALMLLNMAMAMSAAGEAISLSINASGITFDVDDQPYALTGQNAISVADTQDGGSGIYEITLAINDGTITLSQITGLTFTTGDGTADSIMTFEGTIADINAALDGLTIDGASAGVVSITIPFSNTTEQTEISRLVLMNITDVSADYGAYYEADTNLAAYDGSYMTYGDPDYA